jgi:hypothetical protein
MFFQVYQEMHNTGSETPNEDPSRGDEDWVDGKDRGDDDNSSYGEEYNDEEWEY